MEMQVLREGLAPRVEDRGDPDRPAEMTRIAPEREQRVGRGAEEQPIEHAWIALREGIEIVRQGEDDVEVRDKCFRKHLSRYVRFLVMCCSTREGRSALLARESNSP